MGSSFRDSTFDALQALLRELGSDGGILSPSFYDTAQTIRCAGDGSEARAALDWLVAHQGEDGGWGDPAVPLGRDAPTLAVLLALRAHETAAPAQQRALEFLASHAAAWAGPVPEDAPIGAELIVPHLLEEAAAAGVAIDSEPYAALLQQGEKRRQLILRLKPGAGTTALHSWEAWGTEASPQLLDRAGSIGHSPAATAAWLRAARAADVPAAHISRAQEYLAAAARATQTGIPGVVPTVFPIARFEKLWAPYALLLARQLHHPIIWNAVEALIDDTAAALDRHEGLGFSDDFTPDGDDTAAGLALLLACGRPANLALLEKYRSGDHFCTWPYEMNLSLSTTTRAIHALALAGCDVRRHRDFLLARQDRQGRWVADKWHRSWLYTTCHAIAALADTEELEHRNALERAVAAVLEAQRDDGSWGTTTPFPCATETAYAVLSLFAGGAETLSRPQTQQALQEARRWFESGGNALSHATWIGKEAYRPYRVDRSFELAACLALACAASPSPLSQTHA